MAIVALLAFSVTSKVYAEDGEVSADAEFSASSDNDSFEESTSSSEKTTNELLGFPVVETGWQAGFSTGFGMGTGQFAPKMGTLGDTQRGMIPLQIDVGYRILPSLFVGGYVQAGFLLLKKGGICVGEENTCNGQDYRAGLSIHYHFISDGLLDPWVGAGAGYEWYYYSVSYPTSGVGTYSLLFKGWEMVNLRVGLDIHETRQGALGPFVSWSMGQFAALSQDGIPGDDKTKKMDLSAKSSHTWIVFGIQGSYFDDF